MQKINFTKMVASGNDFVVIDASRQSPDPRIRVGTPSRQSLAKKICHRQFGVGADGMLVLEKSRIADIKMRIFNADGSEAEMCGNGARSVARWLSAKRKAQGAKLKIETKAGIIAAQVDGDNVKIKLTDPKGIKLDIPIKVNNHSIKVNFIDTGVPHVVIFAEGLEEIDVAILCRAIRYHKHFAPRGTNVNFIEVLNKDSFKIRTYERGVEGETLACGTGCVASALIFALKTKQTHKINAHTKSSEVLSVYFKYLKNKFSEVCLQGEARIVLEGVFFS